MVNESYLSVTAHFVDSNWALNHRTLATLPLDDNHSGDNIACWLSQAMEKYQVPSSKVVALVHDNGSNMVAACKLLEAQHGWASVRCTAHTIQLLVHAALKTPAIADVFVIARRVVEHFRRSALSTAMLHGKQDQMSVPNHQLVLEVSTRWNSTLAMVQRLLEQRWPVSAVLSDKGGCNRTGCQNLSNEQWDILGNLETLLKPFEAATVFVSGEVYVTASAVSRIIKTLCTKMSVKPDDPQYVSEFKQIAMRQLEERWSLDYSNLTRENEKRCLTVLKAAALDPRFQLWLYRSRNGATCPGTACCRSHNISNAAATADHSVRLARNRRSSG